MKLKEKLANEYAHPKMKLRWSVEKASYEGFLAGFEKAREMAVFVANGIHTETDWKVGHDIFNAGEEEVKPAI